MLAGLFVRLLGADPDQLLEHVAHLHVVHVAGGQIELRERLDDLVEQVLLGHARDLLIEREPLHDAADVRRELADVPVEVGREETFCSRLRTTFSGLPLSFGYSSSTLALVDASRQSKRRNTVNGRITLRYSLRLYGPRSRLQILQMKLAS